ncbi:MAG: hypothetical protein GC179_16205 [Anaerolineaceae bacterium]|nr:hypothetical protein [Anaerolineaceae bacterium]
MELLFDLLLTPIIGFILAQIIKNLPAKIQLFLGSIIMASIAAPLAWVLFESLIKSPTAEGQAATIIPIVFVVILLLTFFGINHVQTRRNKTFTQDQFARASDLIRAYQFQKALDILAGMNHPQAREWEVVLIDMIRNDPDFLHHLESG